MLKINNIKFKDRVEITYYFNDFILCNFYLFNYVNYAICKKFKGIEKEDLFVISEWWFLN